MSNEIISHANVIAGKEQPEGGLTDLVSIKKPQVGYPLITIITATFNAAELLPRTIKSIRESYYRNIEWIVIDGNSSDQTVDIIRENEDLVDRWVSEPDSGVYDAWNKGILLARGDWLAFLGAGDSYNPDAINIYMDAIRASSIKPELVSSRVRLVDNDGLVVRVKGVPFKWAEFKKHMTISHVGALHHRCLFERHGFFDTSYSSAADYEFIMRCGASLRTEFVDDVTADMLVGGISNGYKGLVETCLIQKKYGGGVAATLRFWLACTKRFIRPFVRGY